MRAGPFLAHSEDMPKAVGEEGLPAVVPGVVLGKVSVISHTLETELSRRGLAVSVKGCKVAAEVFGIRHVVIPVATKVVELAEVKVSIGICRKRAPSDWFGAELRDNSVDGVGRGELSPKSLATMEINRHLDVHYGSVDGN